MVCNMCNIYTIPQSLSNSTGESCGRSKVPSSTVPGMAGDYVGHHFSVLPSICHVRLIMEPFFKDT